VSDYTIESVVSSPFEQNAYLIWRREETLAVVIDPGFDTESLLDEVRRRQLHVAAILDTHGHADHIAGNFAIKQAFPAAPLWIGCNDRALLLDPKLNLSASFGAPFTSPDADRTVADGERLGIAGFVFEAREIPGHSPGSVVYICEEFDPPIVFGGDVLFAGSIGRTDLAGGNLHQLLDGIRTKLFVLPDATVVYPGHGPATTIGQEKRSNPFVGLAAERFRTR
jgi:glyoxylase-like metal-dependent hydrolase (beta-lactamase superfamily II)